MFNKRSRPKKYILYDSVFIYFKKRQKLNNDDRIRTVVAYRRNRKGGLLGVVNAEYNI